MKRTFQRMMLLLVLSTRAFAFDIDIGNQGDQVLTPMSPRISISAQHVEPNETIAFELVFPDESIWHLGTPSLRYGRYVLDLKRDPLENLMSTYGGKIGKLKIKTEEKSLITNLKFLIGLKSFDYGCESPILIADYNGTLDMNDECTTGVINRLSREHDVKIVVVSTSGSFVRNSVMDIGFELFDSHIMVLDSVPSAGPVDEKALRAMKALYSANFCILGFAGDTPSKEAQAALSMDIPYLGVNTPKTFDLSSTNHPHYSANEKTWCDLDEKIEFVFWKFQNRY